MISEVISGQNAFNSEKKLFVKSNKEDHINENTFDKMGLKIVKRGMITYDLNFTA